ncbi:MAG TPA: sugar phosphate isomerase/epimerase family protein [Abditibacteriaceae bacterium]|jgi:sugar phosphate isomerase/epimerase
MAEELALGLIVSLQPIPTTTLHEVRDMGIATVQISYPETLDNEDGIGQIQNAVAQSGIEITTVFCGYPGESYADIPTVHDTVGLVPEATRKERIAMTQTISQFAQKIGVSRVAAHIGFIPEDPTDQQYPVLVQILQQLCDDVATRGQVFALETGQETAVTLRRFLSDVARDNLRVNFDPANMILYGNDNPLQALPLLAPYIDGVHCKDGRWPTEKNQLGHETPLGEGDVNIPLWLEKLLETGYRGTLTLEREISGEQQKRDVLCGKELIESTLRRLGY